MWCWRVSIGKKDVPPLGARRVVNFLKMLLDMVDDVVVSRVLETSVTMKELKSGHVAVELVD